MDPAARNRLAEDLEAVITRLQGIHALLLEERNAIGGGNVESIDGCNRRKQQELDTLGGELGSALALVAQGGESPDIQGLGRLLQREAAGDRHWRALQQRLESTLRDSQDLNQINGYLAFTGQREATALLGLLLQDRGGAGEELTYDPSGKTGAATPRGGTTRKA